MCKDNANYPFLQTSGLKNLALGCAPSTRFYLLCQNKTTLPAVIPGPHGEVDPMAACLIALNEELIIIPLGIVGYIQEDGGIADGLFKTRYADIHGAARQVVARW